MMKQGQETINMLSLTKLRRCKSSEKIFLSKNYSNRCQIVFFFSLKTLHDLIFVCFKDSIIPLEVGWWWQKSLLRGIRFGESCHRISACCLCEARVRGRWKDYSEASRWQLQRQIQRRFGKNCHKIYDNACHLVVRLKYYLDDDNGSETETIWQKLSKD